MQMYLEVFVNAFLILVSIQMKINSHKHAELIEIIKNIYILILCVYYIICTNNVNSQIFRHKI